MLAACYLNAVNIKRKIYRLENFARTSSIANESSRMAFYSTFLFNTFKTLLSVRVFLQRCLPTVSLMKLLRTKCVSLEREAGMVSWWKRSPSTSVPRVRFPNPVRVISGLSLSLVLYTAQRGFPLGTPVFTSPQKPTFSNSNSILYCVDIDFWTSSCTSLVLRM